MRVVSATFEHPHQAENAIHELRVHHFDSEDVRLVAQADKAIRAAHEQSVAQRDVRTGMWAGALFGAIAGGLIGLISIVFNPFLPLLIIVGAIAGAVFGKASGHRMAQDDEREVEKILHDGGTLVVVRQADEARAKEALELLEKAGARSAAMAEEGDEVSRA